ncbi:PREDICTED: F-box protein CPR30-like [Fragaria vesca subsp. vesca]
MHSSKAIENMDVLTQRLKLVFTKLETGRVYSLYLDQLLNHMVDGLLVYKELSTGYDCRPLFAVDICNRLLFFRGCDKFDLITYPATRESRKVPKTPTWRLPNKLPSEPDLFYGFGFDYSTNQYKVVYAKCYSTDGRGNINEGNGDGVVFSVYTLMETSSSWRRVEGVYPYVTISFGGTVLNGCVHWLARRGRDRDGPLLIVSFLLAEEEVKEIPLPPICSTGSRQLGVFRNWLRITLWEVKEVAYNEFLVTKEYGVRDSWTKMQNLPLRAGCIHRVGIYVESLASLTGKEEEHERLEFKPSPL